MLKTKQIRLHEWQLKWLEKKSKKNRVNPSSMIRFCVSLFIANKCKDAKCTPENLEKIEFEARKSIEE